MFQTLNHFHKDFINGLPYPRMTWAYDRDNVLILVQARAKRRNTNGVYRVLDLKQDTYNGTFAFQVTAKNHIDAIALANQKLSAN